MRRHQMRLDPEPQNPQAFLQVELPYRRVPLRWSTLQHFGAPDVVDEHVDAAMLGTDTCGQSRDLRRFEMVDGDGTAPAAEFGHQLEPPQVAALAERIRAEHGRIDVLVNDIWGAEVLK